jgi:hypothetical protein
MKIRGGVCWVAVLVVALTGCAATRKPVVECRFPRQAAPPPGHALVAQEYGEISPIPLDAVQYTDAAGASDSDQYGSGHGPRRQLYGCSDGLGAESEFHGWG